MSARVKSVLLDGGDGIVVDIECTLSNNLPNIVIVGYANRAVEESKERIRGAFANTHIQLPRKRITVNLAPADLPKTDSGFDLAIAMAIMLAGELLKPRDSPAVYIGELGLEGDIRPVRGIIGKLLAARDQGISECYVPAANLDQAELVPEMRLVPVDSLRELYLHLTEIEPVEAVLTSSSSLQALQPGHNVSGPRLSEVVGQLQAKRALEIAAAGGHNLLLSGPPGTGKSMLAKALPSILPALTHEEMLEVTHLHSLSSNRYERLQTDRPFRAPHHSSSHVSIIGGGSTLRPGEISLAHRGVLFFDELPEFNRATLEALRQPLEDKIISLARARSTADYPANFILIGTANPCPCGYYGTSGTCICRPHDIANYQQRLSGPIMDRIDLYADVHEVEHDKLLGRVANPEYDQLAAERVTQARRRQAKRYAGHTLNADMSNADLKRHANMTPEATALLNRAAKQMNISARSYMRCVKVARTIADLDDLTEVSAAHISEALAYRRRPTPEF